MKLRTSIWILIASALLGMIVVASLSLLSLRKTMLEERQHQIGTLVTLGHAALEKLHQKELRGELTREEAQRQAKLIIGSYHKDARYYFIRDFSRDTLLLHPDSKRIGNPVKEDAIKKGDEYRAAVARAAGTVGFIVSHDGTRPGVAGKVAKLYGVKQFAPWDWLIGYGDYIDDISDAFWKRVIQLAAIGLLLIGLIAALALYIARTVMRQLGGEPRYAASVALTIAEGDLSQSINASTGTESLLGAMSTMQNGLRQMVERVSHASTQLTGSATELSHQMEQISRGAHMTSESTASTAAAVEQMSVSINHISDSARETEKNSQQAADLASQGETLAKDAADEIRRISSAVSDAAELIRGLVERSREIDSMSAVIKEISDQTNLLALNAAIEAARAGEQGRGFSVVADEVRKLAERTGGATQDITRTIRAVQADTDAVANRMDDVRSQVTVGVQLTEQAATALREINLGAHASLTKSRDVAGAAQEQSQASNSIASNIERIAQMVEEANAAVQSADNQVRQLSMLARELQQEASRFKL